MSSLTNSDVRVLTEALDDEYRAWATYDQVIADFGEVRPFINIREVLRNLQEASQQRHLPAFQRCAQRRAGVW